MMITPLGRVSEEKCTGLSVEMTAYSRMEKEFRPFTQMEKEDDDSKSDASCPSKVSKETSRTKQSKRSMDRSNDSKKKSRCVSPLESPRLLPGTKAFAIPYFHVKSTTYLKCLVRDHRLTSMGEQYKVEFVTNALEKKKQWILARNVVRATEMTKRIELARDTLECEGEELIGRIAEKVRVSTAFVGGVLSRFEK
jgi:hypothetical protein